MVKVHSATVQVHKKWTIQSESDEKENKTGLPKVGAISKAQKAPSF